MEELQQTALNEKPLELRLRKKRQQVDKAKAKHAACGHAIIDNKTKREELVKQLAQVDDELAAQAKLVRELREAAEALDAEFALLEEGGGRAEADEDEDEVGTGCTGAVPKASGVSPPLACPLRGSPTEQTEWVAMCARAGYASFTEMCVAMGCPDPAALAACSGALALTAPPPASPPVLADGEKSAKKKREGESPPPS